MSPPPSPQTPPQRTSGDVPEPVTGLEYLIPIPPSPSPTLLNLPLSPGQVDETSKTLPRPLDNTHVATRPLPPVPQDQPPPSSNQAPLAAHDVPQADDDAFSEMMIPPTPSGNSSPFIQPTNLSFPNFPPAYLESPPPSVPPRRVLPIPRSSSDPAISSLTAADRVAANPRPTSVLQASPENIDSDAETLRDVDLDIPLVEYYKSPAPSTVDLPQFDPSHDSPPPIADPPPVSLHVDPGPPPVYAVSDRDVRLERLGDELAPDSSVWCTYTTAADAHDKDMVDGWNKSLDVLLIFASLFSAVVTAFVIESAKSLQPDYNQQTALLTAQLINVLTNVNGPSQASSQLAATRVLDFKTPGSSKAVNMLWFSALGFSLSSVLIAMLAKQWLSAYESHSQNEPLNATCERQRKFDGLHRWSLPYVLGALPTLLHVSLFLFLAGLIIYLWNLDSAVSQTTCTILGLLIVFYFVSGMLAVFNPDCPYQTPLSKFIRSRVSKAHKSKKDPHERLISTSVMWLAKTNDPKTVCSALQSLAGLRRGFTGFKEEHAELVARLALDHLRTCFITEWRNGGTYNLRSEKQYDASCYLRTLMHFVDDPRRAPSTQFSGILIDPALPIFMQLLGGCPERSIALLASCDYQRLLHRREVAKWLSPQLQHLRESGEFARVAELVQHEPSKDNMGNILKLLNDYLKARIFLHPYTVEVAVETIAFAPIAWVADFSPADSLRDYLDPLVRLLRSTRGSGTGIRRMLARTVAMLSQVHALSVFPQPDDLVMRFQYALDLSLTMIDNSESEYEVREMLLLTLSYWISTFEEKEVLTENFFNELFYECDRRNGIDEASFTSNTATAALLPLLLAPSLSHDQKGKVITSLYANIVSAATEVDPSRNILTFPPDAFPSDTVPFLIRTLDSFKENTHSWLGDTSILLYVVSREYPHRGLLLVQAPVLITIVNMTVLEEVANRLFWILTTLLWDAVRCSDDATVQGLISAGIIPMLSAYSDKYGLTPADAHAWAEILALPSSGEDDGAGAPETVSRRELTEKLCRVFEGQDEERSETLFRLREPIYQFSYQYSTAYTNESALEALRGLKRAYADPDAPSPSPSPSPEQLGLPPSTSQDVPEDGADPAAIGAPPAEEFVELDLPVAHDVPEDSADLAAIDALAEEFVELDLPPTNDVPEGPADPAAIGAPRNEPLVQPDLPPAHEVRENPADPGPAAIGVPPEQPDLPPVHDVPDLENINVGDGGGGPTSVQGQLDMDGGSDAAIQAAVQQGDDGGVDKG